MNEAKQKQNLDGWLAQWQAPERSDDAWDKTGETVADRVVSLRIGHGEDAWFSVPLKPEPGEPDQPASGEVRMSEPPGRPKRQSLKDIAKRVSTTGPIPSTPPPRPSTPPASTTKTGSVRPPASTGAASSSVRPGPSSELPPQSLRAAVSRPQEAKASDSGIVDLAAVRQQAPTASTGAKPGTEGLFDDAAEGKEQPRKVASVTPIKQKPSSRTIFAATAATLAAFAAGTLLFINSQNKASDEAPMMAQAAWDKRPAEMAAAAPPAATAAPVASMAMAENEAQDLLGSGMKSTGPGAPRGAAKSGAHDEESKSKAEPTPTAAPPPPSSAGGSGDMYDEMRKAVGAKAEDKTDDSKKSNVAEGSIPESPSQGAISGALGSVMGAARGCVAGMEEPSKATIVFGSDGKVQSVSVSGPAASTPAGGCIKSALSKARVGPFQRSTFSVGATIRP